MSFQTWDDISVITILVVPTRCPSDLGDWPKTQERSIPWLRSVQNKISSADVSPEAGLGLMALTENIP
jgi:hypothetical protein